MKYLLLLLLAFSISFAAASTYQLKVEIIGAPNMKGSQVVRLNIDELYLGMKQEQQIKKQWGLKDQELLQDVSATLHENGSNESIVLNFCFKERAIKDGVDVSTPFSFGITLEPIDLNTDIVKPIDGKDGKSGFVVFRLAKKNAQQGA